MCKYGVKLYTTEERKETEERHLLPFKHWHVPLPSELSWSWASILSLPFCLCVHPPGAPTDLMFQRKVWLVLESLSFCFLYRMMPATSYRHWVELFGCL